MERINEAIVVEGKYDKIKLSSVFDTVIISTDGFKIFNNPEKQKLLRKISEKQEIIIFTDSDRAGFIIRSFLCGILDNSRIKHAYIPQIRGKEKRKDAFSKDGFLGVEGVTKEIIYNAVISAAGAAKIKTKINPITKTLLYEMGLTGGADSKAMRAALLKYLDLPLGITSNHLIEILNSLYTCDEFINEYENFISQSKE